MGFVGKSFFVQSGKEYSKEFCSTKQGWEQKYTKVITIKIQFVDPFSIKEDF